MIRSCINTSAWFKGNNRTNPSLRVVCDVHDCLVDRHKKNSSFLRTSMATEQVAVQFSQSMYNPDQVFVCWFFRLCPLKFISGGIPSLFRFAGISVLVHPAAQTSVPLPRFSTLLTLTRFQLLWHRLCLVGVTPAAPEPSRRVMPLCIDFGRCYTGILGPAVDRPARGFHACTCSHVTVLSSYGQGSIHARDTLHK